MAPRRKRHPWPTLQFTEDFAYDAAALRLLTAAAASTAQGPLPCAVAVPKVPFLQRTSSWFYNPFPDITQNDGNVQRRAAALKRGSKANKDGAAWQNKSKKDDQENRRVSRGFVQLELYAALSADRQKRLDASSVLRERSSKNCLDTHQREIRSPLQMSVNRDNITCGSPEDVSFVKEVMILAPDTPESEYGMTIKMRQLHELKQRRLFF